MCEGVCEEGGDSGGEESRGGGRAYQWMCQSVSECVRVCVRGSK